ncbi:hypothetical protein L1G54_000434 [Staphylococcus pseudintermedius]|nr:hypothetical protein [Staphylococcus pseudintermedius]
MAIYKNKLMKGVDIMNDLAGFEGLIYSRDELKGELQEKREKQREFAKTIKQFNYTVTESKDALLQRKPVFTTFEELGEEELGAFYIAGYNVQPFQEFESEGNTYVVYAIQLKLDDYKDLDDLEDLSEAVDELHNHLEWRDIEPLVRYCALYNHSAKGVFRRKFIALLREILKDKPELKELLKLK